jgi:electron transfer flavoprotein alpha/beta subunit
MARKRPIAKLTLAEIGAVGEEKVQSAKTHLPETSAARLFDGDPATATKQLVAALRDAGVL